MPGLSLSFILGLVVLFYLFSFVFFAIVRIATGISIQRIGYLSLRHIAYTPRDGIRIDLRGLGLHLHRPTFARPTWVSLRLTELKVTVDVRTVSGGRSNNDPLKHAENDGPSCALEPEHQTARPPLLRRASSGPARSQTWKRLTVLKERIKRLHEKIHWIRMVDVEILNSTCIIKDIASMQLGSLTMAVDTRRRTVDRGRLFRHKKVPAGEQRPAEWMFVMKGVLFTPEGKESIEIIDICSLNVHGLLYKDLAGLRDASISLKLGRIHIPYDDLMACRSRIERCQFAYGTPGFQSSSGQDISLTDMMEELDMPGSREEKIVQTVSDSKDFVSSILRGIQEIQLAVSFIGMSKGIHAEHDLGRTLYLNLAMNEFGIDLYRLDPKSPAHRMYFSPKDIAHQALLAAISIQVSVDDGDGKPERLVYIPMATTTIKTTLPSKTVTFSEDADAATRNANMLFANLVITSPSIDLDLKHMPIVLALFRHYSIQTRSQGYTGHRHHLISRLLPKASVKFSVQEPVARVVLPPMDDSMQGPDDYDLLISSISSISLDMESSHSSAGELHYALNSDLRITTQQFYYQTASGVRHNILLADALELKVQISATPQVYVAMSGNLQTFSVHMVRPEIITGVHRIVQQLRKTQKLGVADVPVNESSRPSFLRQTPNWLIHVNCQGSDFSLELSGVDPGVSKDTRGVALQLQLWTAEYKSQEHVAIDNRPNVKRGMSGSTSGDESFIKATASVASRRKAIHTADGRRLAIHAQGFQGFVAEGVDAWEHESFISIPRFEIACSTSSDSRGSVFHISSHMRALFINYSLYRYYALGVANMVMRQAFFQTDRSMRTSKPFPDTVHQPIKHLSEAPVAVEHITIDVKAAFVQVKADMPADPPMMLQVHDLEAGRHRWAAPFCRSQSFRLFCEAPKIQHVWARLVSIKQCRIDLRESRRQSGKNYVTEKSIDISTEFVRLAVPHQLVLHKVFDNFVNIAKATEQLHHRFATGTDDYVLNKMPEEPKLVPRISIRSKALLFELEDGFFDWKLGLIYRVGLIEQKQRLAREEAYRIKLKRLEEQSQRREMSRYRTQSSIPKARGRSKRSDISVTRERSKSKDYPVRRRSSSTSGPRGRSMRYDPEGVNGLTGAARISAQEAWRKLQEHNAQSWRKRIRLAIQYQSGGMHEIRSIFRGNDEFPDNVENSEDILSMPARPGLMATLISDLHVIVDKPSFPIEEYSRFLQKVGKGMPYNMEYSLLIPMSLQINMGEARMTLRDYPLPLLHVPAIKAGQSPRLPSWSLKTDFVIAEEYRDCGSIKHVKVEVVPPNKITSPAEVRNGFCIDVRRTISPVKTYSNVEIAINTSNPTSITWGTSYQPAIQDMMQIIEGFTKPQLDPSDRTGFWDKIRLSVHSRVRVAWKGDGDVLLKLKGSRDPYIVTGHGAGFVMCFRENVCWEIHQDDDPKKFMTVSSGEYVMAIPDYGCEARSALHGIDSRPASVSSKASTFSASSYKSNAMFKKVVMKLSGNVRWLAGLVFERDLDDGGRSFDFVPHYAVTLKTPGQAKAPPGRVYDAFRGFRSQHIHLSIAVVAPVDRDWSVTNLKPSSSYNSIHMTPRFFTHFFDWWSLFSGIMSLPIRQGKLFPGIEKSTKKFGRHLATIKYSLLLSPLFISHIYKHKDAEDYSAETVGATGLKLRIDSFMLDLHQRREDFSSKGSGRMKQTRTTAMRINQAQLDFISADIRAVSASIAGTSPEDLKRATDEDLAALQDQTTSSPDVSRFTIPDNDYLWIDMDDFVELDWILPAETHPETKIMPLAFAPRFSYFRQTDHNGTVSGDPARSSAFGDEPTHYCIMSQDNDPQRVQGDLIRDRISVIDEQLKVHQRTLGEQELRVVRDGPMDPSLKEHYELLSHQGKLLEEKRLFLESMFERLSQSASGSTQRNTPDGPHPDHTPEWKDKYDHKSGIGDNQQENAQLVDFISDFNNRFIVHNVQLKWNNSLRNIILRYVHQVSQRRGFVYYMSRRAVKFILDIVDEQNRNKEKLYQQSQQRTPTNDPSPSMSFKFRDEDSEFDIDDRIEELLNDGKNFVNADDPEPPNNSPGHASTSIGHNISEEFTPQNSYHVRLIAPQIQLQSEKNAKAVLSVTAKGMQLKVVQIMDKTRLADDVSGLVQRRFSVDMDGVQFFVTTQKALTKFIHLYSLNRYGASKGSAWPPWVPIEVNFDFNLNPFGWSRVVQKTSASLRYDKYNTLRLKYNDEVTKGEAGHSHNLEDPESRIDHLWVEFPHIRAICDSTQYYAMYLIVLDLLLYSEPLEKIRSERLEKIMLAADFSDLTGAPEMVVSLQERIQQLEEIKSHFQLHAQDLDRQGWQDRLMIERDLTSCEDELFFMMKAITTSQRKFDDRSQASQSNGLLRWYLSASEIVWHLMREKNDPLMEIQLKHAAYDRTDNSDGSNYNTMEIERIHGLNLLSDALYPEMLAPYFENGQPSSDGPGEDIKMFKVQWYMLEAIAGIPVLDQFEVNLFPLKVQLEREIGKKLFEYIFPSNAEHGGPSPFMVKQLPPVQDEDEESDAEPSIPTTPTSLTPDPVDTQPSTRAGSLELRLRPTMNLPEPNVRLNSSNKKTSASDLTNGAAESHRFKLFHNSNRSKSANRSQTSLRPQSIRTISRRRSGDSLRSLTRSATSISSTNLSSMNGTADRSRRFGLHRTSSKDNTNEKDKNSDDLTQMMSRASNYMTLAYVKIPSVVLCLSYKGRGERNIEDVHDFVFRMPALEYRNKTWSNLDLALRLKKDIIKALISHTGAIIGNKFSHHRPNKHQQSRLREIANLSSLLPNTDSLANPTTNSSFNQSQFRERPSTSHPSFIAGWNSTPPTRSPSDLSSHGSLISPGNKGLGFSLGTLPDPKLDGHPDQVVSQHSIPADGDHAGNEPNHSRFLNNAFARRITNEGQKIWHRDSNGLTRASTSADPNGVGADSDEKSRKTGVIQLGKKILGSLN
ncbi:hypothetical protein MMC34_003064 [Xylographa carneopallida]|nr:hypothetical protein [Xylographa carneopallida]